MNDAQLLRYSRHILLDEIGMEGQEALARARILVIGAGGLGSPIALYLAASGIGHITICDADDVELSNLQRQIAHPMERIGDNKAESAAIAMRDINPEITVTAFPEAVNKDNISDLVSGADIVVDASDNFATRHLVNRESVRGGKPLVSGAAIRFDGQVSVFDPREADSPCYHCLFPEDAQDSELRCAEAGVFSPLVGIVGTLQAAEAVKIAAGIGSRLVGRLMLVNAREMDWRVITLKRDVDCSVCSRRDGMS